MIRLLTWWLWLSHWWFGCSIAQLRPLDGRCDKIEDLLVSPVNKYQRILCMCPCGRMIVVEIRKDDET